jgi:hypothetical protein
MRKSAVFPFLIGIFVVASCSKQPLKEELKVTEKQVPYKNELVACNCADPSSGKVGIREFIKAEFNGVPICADLKLPGGTLDTFSNMLQYGKFIKNNDTLYYDNLYMLRYTRDNKFLLALYMENSYLLTKTFPYVLPRANSEISEMGQFQLQNQEKITQNMCQFCDWNDWHYWGLFWENNLHFIADKYENGIFYGRFEGQINTGSGRKIIVKNGSFQIRLIAFEKNLSF